MAYRRNSLSVRATLLARRSNPSFSYLSHFNDRKKSGESQSSGSKIETLLTQRRSFGSCVSQTFRRTPYGQLGRALFGLQGIDRSLRRQISTSSEVAIAAAESAFPSAVVQHFIDGVHCFTGLNWWASIAIATLLARVATLPLSIRTLRQGRALQCMLHEHRRVPWMWMNRKRTVLFIISGLPRRLAHQFSFFSFYFAIDNMAQKVPSFTTGGTLWFTDLSTPDAMCIFPVSMALIYLFRWETCLMMVPRHIYDAKCLATSIRVSAVVLIPLTMFLPKAVLCSWITSSMFNCCVSLAFRNPGVQKLFGIPPHITREEEREEYSRDECN